MVIGCGVLLMLISIGVDSGAEAFMGRVSLLEKCGSLPPLCLLRLFIRKRKQGCYVASVPLKRLVELSGCGFRNWRIEESESGVWLILEASCWFSLSLQGFSL
jgi:hypothetical protein